MVRWASGARDRLERAALELFAARGFDGVTVAEIAEAAGLTERTFFRHFDDKREVLFGGQSGIEERFAAAIDASTSTRPMAMVQSATEAASVFFDDERRPLSRARQAVIDANPALQEREARKHAAHAVVLVERLVARGVPPLTARLAAEAGVSAFHTAFAAWIAEGEERPYDVLLADAFRELRGLVAAEAD